MSGSGDYSHNVIASEAKQSRATSWIASSAFGLLAMTVLPDPHERAAVDRQRDTRDEVRLVRGEEQRRVGDVPGGPHALAQRDLGVAHGGDFGARLAHVTRARVDRHGRV